MNKIKKLASLVLALVMALALAAPAFAAGTTQGTITLDNPQDGVPYTAHKIFDVVYNEDKTNYSYTISSAQGDNAWYDTVKAYAETEGSGLELVATTVENVWTVKITESLFSAPAFAKYLDNAKVTDPKAVTMTVANGVATATVELGYYFVKTSQGALCNLTTTTPDATIHDKNETVFTKTDDKNSVEIGEDVTYTITGKVPATEGYTAYTYQVSDKTSDGLTFNPDTLKVTIGGVELTKDTDYTVSFENNEKGEDFILNIAMLKEENGKMTGKYTFGAEIKITYTATVNENAIASVEENDANLKYSNDPNDTSSFDEENDKTYVYSAQIIVEKVDGSKKPLAGAKFVLKNEEGKFYKYTEATETTPASVSWVDNQEDATEVETVIIGEGEEAKAVADFKGLKTGTYKLVETKAPDGYNLMETEVTITITEKGNTDAEDAKDIVTSNPSNNKEELNGVETKDVSTTVALLQYTNEVENLTGAQLPSTGGIGTTIFYVVGGVLAAGAVILLITKRRMNIDK